MGFIKQEKLANGNIGLEITYGGLEAPFGGVDTSAPPAYIDPKCFTSSNGVLIVNNQIVPVAYQPMNTPVLWSATAGVSLIGFGTFYNSIWGQLNYALGYIATPFGVVGTSPTGVNYTFYITSWNPGNTAQFWNDTLKVSLYDSYTQAANASITLPCLASSAAGAVAGSGATGSITAVNSMGNITAMTMTGGTGFGVGDAVQVVPVGATPSDYAWVYVTAVSAGAISGITIAPNNGAGYIAENVTSGIVEAAATTKIQIISPTESPYFSTPAYVSTSTPGSIVAALVTAIGSDASLGVTATASIDGQSLILTALTPGTAGNAITVQDLSTAELVSNPPPFYFPALVATPFEGGLAAAAALAPRTFEQVSTAYEGGVAYFANLGPMILKYSGPGQFQISTMYQGVKVLRKFAGSLIGLGVTPQLGFEVQNQDMIFTWTAAEELDIWSPLNTSGNVTGAGFAQLADIGDYLAGLIVSNATAFILRAQGISYATETANGTSPFSFNHIGLGDEGEGAQLSALVCQYDQTGAFVGNSDIYKIAGSISSIGYKIKSLLFETLLNDTSGLLGSSIAALYVGGNQFPLISFVIGNTVFVFNSSNNTWTTHILNAAVGTIQYLELGVFASTNEFLSTSKFNQLSPVIAINTGAGYTFNALVDLAPNNLSISNAPSFNFPVEEVSFGRDITIDSLYVGLVGLLVDDITIEFYVDNTLYATLIVTPTELSALNTTPIEFQLNDFSTSTIGAGATTAHVPQLSVRILNAGTNNTNQLRFTKLVMLGSYDPSQRPT